MAATQAQAEPRPAAAAEPTAQPALDQPITILLLGTDTRPGIAASRTDAIMVLHVDPVARRAALLSLPRDLWVPIPGHGQGRVNAAYPIGERQIGRGYGPALAKQTVGDLLGITIQRFVLIDLQGFRALVDQLGGITLDVPAAIEDPAYPTDGFGTIAIAFEAGTQHMDGERALQYARTRHADNDFGRNRRQQQVLVAISQRIQELGPLQQLARIDEYTAALRDYIRTDLSRDELLQLAGAAAWLRPGEVERIALGPNMVTALERPATFAAKPGELRGVVDRLVQGGGHAALVQDRGPTTEDGTHSSPVAGLPSSEPDTSVR